MQNPQVLAVGASRLVFYKQVIQLAEGKRRKEFIAEAILCKGTWLANQRPD
jgi:hypothetical protein